MKTSTPAESAIGGYGRVDLTDFFQPVVSGTYANKVVFTPPVNAQDAVLRAGESLRQAPTDKA
jgi:hypothetical protein